MCWCLCPGTLSRAQFFPRLTPSPASAPCPWLYCCVREIGLWLTSGECVSVRSCVQQELFPRLPRQRSRAVEMPLGHQRQSAAMSPLPLIACVHVLHTETSNWEDTLQSSCCEFPAQLRHFPHEQDVFRAGRNPSFKWHSSLPSGWTLHSSPASGASFPFPLVRGAVGRGVSPFLESSEVQVLRITVFLCGC